MKKVKLYLNYAGHCLAAENHAIQGGRQVRITFQALWGLIQHPEKGWILFDTAYTQRFFEATANYPNKLYSDITKVMIDPEQEVRAQLLQNGISPNDIRHIFISHFHADHVGGLLDFPKATIYVSKKALRQVHNIPRAIAFTRGILKPLIPIDLKSRAIIIEESCSPIEDSILGVKYDLFGDGSLLAVPLPGHAAGQMGLLLETQARPYFLIADACWLKKSYQQMVLPNPIVRVFFHSWRDFKNSLKKVADFHKAHPNTIIVPTHCSETTDVLVSDKFDLDVL